MCFRTQTVHRTDCDVLLKEVRLAHTETRQPIASAFGAYQQSVGAWRVVLAYGLHGSEDRRKNCCGGWDEMDEEVLRLR